MIFGVPDKAIFFVCLFEVLKFFVLAEGCSRTVTSQYQFVNRTTESQINTKATSNRYQKQARSGEEHEKL
ncbi:hypothetical protein Tsubulata_007176, partial [Turnera subulata]